MDPAAFFRLGAGLRFDRQRFGGDIALFSGPTHTSARGKVQQDAPLPSFRAVAPTATQKSGKRKMDSDDDATTTAKRLKRPVVETQQGEEDESEGIEGAGNEEVGDESSSDDVEVGEDPGTGNANVAAQRRRQKVSVLGDKPPQPIGAFEELTDRFSVKRHVLNNLAAAGYTAPTAIQSHALPIMLGGRELLACAPTGSGKTAAFTVPIIAHLAEPKAVGFRAVVVSPTKELAQQTYREFVKLSHGRKFRMCVLTKAMVAGADFGHSSAQRFDILIATPLRLVNLIKEDHIKLSGVEWLVLDEADRLFDLGFLEQIDEIIHACSGMSIRRALFSATMPPHVEQMARSFLVDPIRVTVGAKNSATETINQRLLFVGREDGKLLAMRQLTQEGLKPPVIVFVQSKERAKELFHELVYDGINVDVIHADRTQAQREAIVKNFRIGKIWVLIATDLMSRGMDFKGVGMVINYDFPQSAVSYIHRIGRTGRAGRPGEAITFFTEDDAVNLRSIVNVMRDSGCDVPEWMLALKRPSKKKRKQLEKRPVARDHIKTITKYDAQKISKKRQMVDASKRRAGAQSEGQAPVSDDVDASD